MAVLTCSQSHCAFLSQPNLTQPNPTDVIKAENTVQKEEVCC